MPISEETCIMDKRRRIDVRLDREDRDRSRDFAGPGGYGPELEHSDYGFRNYGAFGDYGGVDRFSGDWRGESGRDLSDDEVRRMRGDEGRREEGWDRRHPGGMRPYGEDWRARQASGRQPPPTTVVVTEIWSIPGPHTGRGPAGYRKSDDRIREDVCEILTRHGDLDATEIEVHVQDGVVELRGNVDERKDKYLAEDLVESLAGIGEVRSRIRVRKSSRSGDYEKKLHEQKEQEQFESTGGSHERQIHRDDRSWSREPSSR
jgi:hypothetical protein